MAQRVATGWRYGRCGPLRHVLSLDTFDVASTPNSVVVKMLAAPLHRVDAAVVSGTVLGSNQRVALSRPFPRIAGSEGVGHVVATGEACTTVKEGDTVWVAPLHGTWASLIDVPATHVHAIAPSQASLAVYASNLLTAYQMLHDYARLRAEHVVIQNAGSSVTALAVAALAQQMGVRVLTAASPSERFVDAQTRLARYASPLFPYTGEGARQMRAVLDSTSSSSSSNSHHRAAPHVALFLNGVGGRSFDAFLDLLSVHGRVVTYGAQHGVGLCFSASAIVHKELTLHGHLLPHRMAAMTYEQRQAQLECVLQALADANFAYPTRIASSLDGVPEVWDDAYVHGGCKAIVRMSSP